MKFVRYLKFTLFASLLSVACTAVAADICEGYGPQTPRDIDRLEGTNERVFSMAPDHTEMNLCNIHFHTNAEHKAKDFSVFVGNPEGGYGGGYQCNDSSNLSRAQLRAPKKNACAGVVPGDTVEVHWVHTSCDVAPGKGLGSCLSEKCATPNLRVETQVFLVVNDDSAYDFTQLTYAGEVRGDYHQAKFIPNDTGAPVEFLGSTTGPAYNEQQCSPLQVSWSVRPQCAQVDINTLSKWCEDNVFEENKAHGVRALVTDPRLLSEIQ